VRACVQVRAVYFYMQISVHVLL